MEVDRRSKMVSLRLSKKEYDMLKQYSRAYGARSISELARLALQRIMSDASNGCDISMEARLEEFDSRLRALESQMGEPQITKASAANP